MEVIFNKTWFTSYYYKKMGSYCSSPKGGYLDWFIMNLAYSLPRLTVKLGTVFHVALVKLNPHTFARIKIHLVLILELALIH